MINKSHTSFYESHKGFDITKVFNNSNTYFNIAGAYSAYSTPKVCKRVIDTYLKRTGQWENVKAPEAKVITISRPAPEYSNKKHG